MEAIRGICYSSNCQAVISKTSILKDPLWPTDSNWNKWILNGGEDYELILSLPKEWAAALSKKLKSAKIIGFIKKGKPKIFWDNLEEIKIKKSSLFQHFKLLKYSLISIFEQRFQLNQQLFGYNPTHCHTKLKLSPYCHQYTLLMLHQQ